MSFPLEALAKRDPERWDPEARRSAREARRKANAEAHRQRWETASIAEKVAMTGGSYQPRKMRCRIEALQAAALAAGDPPVTDGEALRILRARDREAYGERKARARD